MNAKKNLVITYNGNTLIYVFQTPAEDCIHPPTYSSLHFAEVGQRRSMKIGQRKSLLCKLTEKVVFFFLISGRKMISTGHDTIF